MKKTVKKIGLVVNPVAGIGGKTGLKGSDGEETMKKAFALGAVKESGKKALAAIRPLKCVEELIDIYTCPGEMGADICKEAGLKYRLAPAVGGVSAGLSLPGGGESGIPLSGGSTSAEDTVHAARALAEMGADLILFAGGDGTARDVMDGIGLSRAGQKRPGDIAGTETPVLGIPAGCKIHSGVYALNPGRAGELAVRFAQGKVAGTREAEVMDIDEEEFRKGRVQSRLYGYLKVPDEPRLVQDLKSGSRFSERDSIERLSDYIVDTWDPEALYIVGGGSTTACIMKKKNLPNTLLGVDLVCGGRLVASDCTERQILDLMKGYRKKKILVTVIGGQGHIFGRGNQQISSRVIRGVGRENIIVAASPDKMLKFVGKCLYVDMQDEETDKYLSGYMRVVTGYGDFVVVKVTY